jgi:glutathione synthase/RimK-type ligase-like ATP-grasp enzyme
MEEEMQQSNTQQSRVIKLALATSSKLPGWEIDDAPFHRELEGNFFEILHAVWDDKDICWSDFDACVIRTTWDYSEKQEEFREWIQFVSQQTLLINSATSLLWNLNKNYLFELSTKGIPIAPSVILEPEDDIPSKFEMLSHVKSERFFCKPLVGASAIHTLRFDKGQLHLLIEHCQKIEQPMILQPYISSVETEGEVSLIYFGNEFSHAVQKIPVKGDYRVQDDHGASDRPFLHVPQGLFELANRILEVLPEKLSYVRLDFLNLSDFSSNDWVVNEVECIEPSLFFRHSKEAPQHFVKILRGCISRHLRSI